MAELIPYQVSKDVNYPPTTDIIFPSKYINAYILAAGVATSVTVPTGARVAVFNSTGNFYADFQGTAVVPTVDIINGEAPEINPVTRDVSSYTGFSLIAPSDCIVTIAYFA